MPLSFASFSVCSVPFRVRSSVPSPSPNSSLSKLKTACSSDNFADLLIYRLALASLILSAMAISAVALMLPILRKQLDEMNEMATKQGKQFKQTMADEIWRDLERLHKKLSNEWQMQGRERRELQMLDGESRGFLNQLERKSYKGRQRMKQSKGEQTEEEQNKQQYNHKKKKEEEKPPNWELYTKRSESIVKRTKVPQANALRTLTRTNGTTKTTEEPTETGTKAKGVPIYGKTASKRGQTEQRVKPIGCPKGLPGYAGKTGYDGIPGVPGEHGKKGESGDEIQRKYESIATKCIVCPAGAQGLPGPKGPQGEKGEDGTNGTPGTPRKEAPAGAAGPIGEVGQPGKDGPNGTAGAPGESGTKYQKGQMGPKGDKGPKGERGDWGERGTDGKAGTAGEMGYQGWPGEMGPLGRTGPIGPNGVPGISGAGQLYCNCPVRSSQLNRLKDYQPGGRIGTFFSRWRGLHPNELLNEYEKYAKENEEELPKKMEEEKRKAKQMERTVTF